MGRAALDEDAIRLIEENNPDVTFDWTRILKGESPLPEPRKQTWPRRDVQSGGSRGDVVEGSEAEVSTPAQAYGAESFVVEDDALTTRDMGFENLPLEGDSDSAEPAAEPPPTPAHARLGAEGVLRLRGRYSELIARIRDRISDPARQEELRGQAERLNPDTWVTDNEVRRGLEEYEAVFASLHGAVGRPRRRRRRRGARPNPPGSAAPSADVPETVSAGGDEDGDDSDER